MPIARPQRICAGCGWRGWLDQLRYSGVDMNNKNKKPQEEALDDVDRLFARLGSQGAEGYLDFTPGKLPARETAPQAAPAAPVQAAPPPLKPASAASAAEPVPPPSPPILASIRPLRAEPAPMPVQRLSAVAAAAPASPLGELFRRLLQAEAAPVTAGPLRRMFGR